MTAFRTTRSLIAAAALSSVAGLCSPGFAQMAVETTATQTSASVDPAARATLDAAGAALQATPGFGAQFRMLGDGSDLIKSTMPSMNGRFVFGTANDERVIHMLGEAKDTADADSYAFDFTRSASRIAWTDDAKQTVNIRNAKPEPRAMPGALRMVLVQDILNTDPYAAALARSESIVSEGTREVAGVTCDVVLMTFRKNSGVSHTGERWFVAQSDKLPRRMEQITDAGMIKFQLIMEFSGLTVGEQAPAMLDVRRPETYKVDDRTIEQTKATPARPVRAAPGSVKKEAATTATQTKAAPVRRPAPAFAFTDDGGAEIDNNSQMGRVSVMYFWGTWCVPCRAVSPEISKIAQRFSEQDVDVFGVAVRERDPEAARSYLAEKNYEHRLVLGADTTARSFQVRIYPTVVVIDQEGRVAYSGSPGRDRNAMELASEVAAAVQDALSEG